MNRDDRLYHTALGAWHRVLACAWLSIALACVAPLPASAQVSHGPPRIRNVYIPADQLELLFENSSKGVLMPREEVLALWKEANLRTPPGSVPPVDVVPAQAAYEAHLGDHELRLTGRIQIAKLQRGWQKLDLAFGGLAIESAEIAGRPATFGRGDDGTPFLMLQEEGRFELVLRMSAPLASKGGDLATTLKLPAIPASEILLHLDEGKQLQLGETPLQAELVENGAQCFRVAVDGTGTVPLVISDRFSGGDRSPLVLVNSRSAGYIEPAGLRWEVVLDLDVCAKAADTFEFALPDSVDIAEVEAPQLDAWTIKEQADGAAVVQLTFRKPFLGRRSVRLLALAPVPAAGEFNLPTVKVLEAASHVGRVSVYAAPSLRVDVGTLAGIRVERVFPAAEQPPAEAAGKPLSLAFWDETFSLPLRVTSRRRAVQASVATLVEIDRTGLVLRASATLQPRHAPVFDVQMQLPRDWEVTSVLCGTEPVQWESAGGGAEGTSLRTVRFDLAAPLNPGESLQIALTAQRHPAGWLEKDEVFHELPLPELRLADVDEVEGTLRLQAPPEIELLVSELSDELQPVAAEATGGGAAEGEGAPESPGTALQYHYQDDAKITGLLRARTKPAKVSAQTLAFVRLDRGKLDMHYQLDLNIRQGKVRRIEFTLPSAVGDKIQIVPLDSPARVIEQLHTAVNDGADYLWRITLDRPVTGKITLALDFGQTFPSPTPGEAPEADGEPSSADSTSGGKRFPVAVLALRNVSRQSGIVAVEAANDQRIDCESENLRDLDPADVVAPAAYTPGQRIVAAYQYPRLPYRLSISATSHDSEPVVTAICESAEIETVATRHGRMRHQARFWVRGLNLQNVSLSLPEEADLWSVMVDSEPVEVRSTQGNYIVPMPPQADSAGDRRDLTLLYETGVSAVAGSRSWDRLRPEAFRQSPARVELTTLATTWCIHPPEGTDVVSSDGDFEPASPLARPTLAGRLAQAIADNSTSALGWKFAGLVAAAVFVGFFALIRTSGHGCQTTIVELTVVIVVIVMLISLLLPATQSAREAARRAACINNLKQLGLALHNYHDAHKQFPPAVIGPANMPRERQFSWIVALLPYMEEGNLYKKLRLDLPCDHPDNAALLRVALPSVLCPSDPGRTDSLEGVYKTSYVAITGAGKWRGVIGFDRGLGVREITDSTSNTVMVAEVIDGGPWYAGGYGTARPIDDWLGKVTWSQHPGVGNFVLADGSVRSVSTGINPQLLRALATAQGGESVSDFHDDFETRRRPAAAAFESLDEFPSAEAEAPMDDAAAPEATEEGAEMAEPGLQPGMEQVPEAAPTDAAPREPAQTLVEEKPPVEVPPQPPSKGGERARLSLSVALEAPSGQVVRFRREGGPGELILGLQDRMFSYMLQAVMIAAALLAAWVWRRVPGPRRAVTVVLGLALPIGLSGLVPLAWTPLLDGLLLGTLASAFLWMFRQAILNLKASGSGPKAATAALVAGVSLFLATGVALAEDQPAAAAEPAATAASRQPPLTLFVPYDPDDNPLENTRVYLPHDEFLRLWKQAHPDAPVVAAADVKAVVSHAEYSGRIEEDVARFDGRLLVHHLAEGWARVDLPFGDLALEKIEIDGRPAALAGHAPPDAPGVPSQANRAAPPEGQPAPPADTGPAIYIEKPGLHVVDVCFSVPVRRLGATGQMNVPLRPVPSGRLLLRLPGDDLEINVGGCGGGWRRRKPSSDDNNGSTDAPGESISIPLGSAGELSIRWQPRRVDLREGELFGVDQSVLLQVLDRGLHFHGRFHYRVQQGAIKELRLGIPSGMAVRQVGGAEVADWSIETDAASDSDPAKRLVVSLKTERTTDTQVDIDWFRPDGRMSETFDVDTLKPLGVVRETGRLAIASPDHFRVRVDETAGLDQIDRAGIELPEEPGEGCALLSAYRYTSRPFRLRLKVERQRPNVEVFGRTAVAVRARQATIRSMLSADVTGAPVAALQLRLPSGLRVSEVRVPQAADWFIDRDEEGPLLKVELGEPALGKLDLAVSGTLVRDSSQAEFAVPLVTMEDVQAQRGQLAVYLDTDLEAALKDGGGARSIAPSALDESLRTQVDGTVHYAFQYDSPPEGLSLRLSAAPSRLNADVTTVVSVREGAVAYISKVDFEIRQAGRAVFQIITPKWLGDDVEIQGEQIRQIRSQPTDQGRTWDVELQQPVRGAYSLQLSQTLPLAEDGTVDAAVIRPLDVERSRSHVVLENDTADEIAATKTQGAAPVSLAEVPEGLAETVRRQAVAAYRINGDGTVLTWQRRVREQESGLIASISLADLTTVIHSNGSYRARVSYNIRNFTLQFLELELPPESRIWSAHVSGQPVRPAKITRQGRTVTLLPLQKTSAGDFSSKVVAVYSGHLGEPLNRWKRIRPPAARILSDVPVSRTLWTVYLPREYAGSLVKSQSNLEEVAAAYQQEERKLSFLDELRQVVQVAGTKGRSAAQTKARYNLKQVGTALRDYAEQSAQVDTSNALEVQEQAQRIESEIQQLEQKAEAERIAGGRAFYFETPQSRGKGTEATLQVDRGLENLPGMGKPGDRALSEKDQKLDEAAADRVEQRRGDLRKQADEQLSKLQSMQQADQPQSIEPPTRQQPQSTEWGAQSMRGGMAASGVETAGGQLVPVAGGEMLTPLEIAGTGPLSLDLDVAPVGTPHHFSKLHGEPKISLSIRHESLGHWLSAGIWAGLCLAAAGAVISGVRRPDALKRDWPWLAAGAGVAWLFLLPAGVFGLVPLVLGLCVLIDRTQRNRTIRPAPADTPKAS